MVACLASAPDDRYHLPSMSIAERRAAEKAQRRDSIVDAGEDVFKEKGFEKSTMADVAARAQLSRALLYVYFKDKDDLTIAVKARAMRRLREMFEVAAASKTGGIEKINAIGRAYLRYSVDHPMYFETVVRPHPGEIADPPEHVEQAEREGQRIFEVMVEAIRTGMADGTIRSDIENPLHLAVALWFHTHGVITMTGQQQPVLDRYGMTRDVLCEESLRLNAEGIVPR